MLSRESFLELHWFLCFCLFALILGAFWLIIGYGLPRILPSGLVSNTSKNGLIFRNERWEGEIKITGDIWAFPGTTVTLSPGTKISVARGGDAFNLDFLPWHLKKGLNTEKEWMGVENGEFFWDEGNRISLYFAKLYALGTKEQPIIIEAEKSLPETGVEFNVLSLKQGIISFAKISNYRKLSVGDKVTIRNSHFKNTGECAICLYFSSPTIAHNIFEGSGRVYIFISGGSPRISDNLFMVSKKGKGIIVDPKQSGAPVIYHNSFEMPNQTALEFLSGNEDLGAAISFNDFAGGSIIKIPCDSRVKFIQNLMRGAVQLAHSGNCVGSLVLGPNYWQSIDRKAVLQEKILDKEPGFEVLIPSLLDSSPSGAGRRPQ